MKEMSLSTASPPPELEDGCLRHDGGCHDTNNDGASFECFLLDDEGFPSQLPGEDPSPNESEKSSFASDFYRSGSDFSSLLSPDANRHRDLTLTFTPDSLSSGKKLKQANLFQIWGFKRNVGVGGSVEFESKQGGYCDDIGEGSVSSEKKKIVTPGSWGSILGHKGKVVEKSNSSSKRKSFHGDNRVTRSCPFYKKMPGTNFTVDAFRYGCVEGCSAYFLSHFHADHYGGLSKKWSHGPIYCSPLTGRLVKMCLYVNPSYICPLEFDTEYVIDGIKVTLIDANHCPGAALIHFELPNGQCYLHTGDFRACKLMQDYHLFVHKRVNVLYLDTTYCNPKYKFPFKEDVLNYVVKITKNRLKMHPRTLVVVGAYSIGKECVYLAISKALGVKIYANASRRRILLAYDCPDYSDRLCTNGNNTLLHVMPMSSLRIETLKEYLKTYKEQFTSVLAFRPTGWTFSEKIGNDLELIKPVSKGNITIYGVPYSEHSSFTELRDFVQFLRPDKIIPTVNVGNAATRENMQSYFRDWLKG
ncbi:unnamed protein product [Vicia faba]|uniref:DNA repair metallo-beta-lactamase domain-containing protein n=1 Tax=Vicia faba TaxID=3906 RepID=A0AAV1ATC4_VICFA|nr:unnamed protein product [Vicia faba]